MARRRTKAYMIGNWKMHPETLSEAERIFDGIKSAASTRKKVVPIICPSFVHLPHLLNRYRGKKIFFGAQDAFWDEKGSYTGEVSPTQIRGLGVEYVILGHSERRALGETNELVAKKVRGALDAKLTPILCVGEKERDREGDYLGFVREQLKTALDHLKSAELKKIIISYEPIWAIGKSAEDAMSPHEMHQMSLYIRKVLREVTDAKTADAIYILYGGSAEPGNVEELFSEGQIDGFLVGHASRDADMFSKMLKIVDSLA